MERLDGIKKEVSDESKRNTTLTKKIYSIDIAEGKNPYVLVTIEEHNTEYNESLSIKIDNVLERMILVSKNKTEGKIAREILYDYLEKNCPAIKPTSPAGATETVRTEDPSWVVRSPAGDHYDGMACYEGFTATRKEQEKVILIKYKPVGVGILELNLDSEEKRIILSERSNAPYENCQTESVKEILERIFRENGLKIYS